MSAGQVVVLAHRQLEIFARHLSTRFTVVSGWTMRHSLPQEARVLAVAGEVPLDPRILERLPNLEYVACVSTGYDGLDIGGLQSRGLMVSVARDVNATDVADHAVGRIIAMCQSLIEADREMKAGHWSSAAKLANRSLLGAKLGIVGLGSVGLAVAYRASAFGMEIAWWGPTAKPATWPRAESLIELAKQSDTLVVTARAHLENRKLISAAVIEALGEEGRLVNVARGSLVDEDALIDALQARRIAGAALDVFETEPTSLDRWKSVPNVILTPHIAGRTKESLQRIVDQLIGNLDRFFSGGNLLTPI